MSFVLPNRLIDLSKNEIIDNKILPDDNHMEKLLPYQRSHFKCLEKAYLGNGTIIDSSDTGTGKTYVYLRTILELNRKYGFQKYIIIVPSVAIREGVLKSLQITKQHLKQIYDNASYNFYEYDSKKLSRIRQFSRNNNVEIMVMTLDSFNKDTNIMNMNIFI